MIDEAAIRLRWDAVGSQLDERGRRLFAAAWRGVAAIDGSATSPRRQVLPGNRTPRLTGVAPAPGHGTKSLRDSPLKREAYPRAR
jgi:hypothetical protein